MKFEGFGSSMFPVEFQGWKAHHFWKKDQQDVTFGLKLDVRGNHQTEGRPIVKLLSNQAKYSLSPHQQAHFYDKCFSSVVSVDG